METHYIFLFTFLAMLVLGLSIYLGFLMGKIRLQREARERKTKEVEEARQARLIEVRESLRIIALAVIQEQCELSEGCIRVKKLLESDDELPRHPALEVIERFYSELEPFAYLGARQELSKQDRFEQDKKRFAIEERYQADFRTSMAKLLELLKS